MDAHSFTCTPTRSSAIGMNHIPAFATYARESFSIRHKRYVFASVCVCLYVHRVTQKVAEKFRWKYGVYREYDFGRDPDYDRDIGSFKRIFSISGICATLNSAYKSGCGLCRMLAVSKCIRFTTKLGRGLKQRMSSITSLDIVVWMNNDNIIYIFNSLFTIEMVAQFI